jgi:hypothetical protein
MTIANNVFYEVRNGATAFYLPTGSGSTSFAGNCVFRTGSRAGNVADTGTVSADPSFTNAPLGDLALSPGSPCAGKGASITSVGSLLSQTGGASPIAFTATNFLYLPFAPFR